jgi:hypothetical protein
MQIRLNSQEIEARLKSKSKHNSQQRSIAITSTGLILLTFTAKNLIELIQFSSYCSRRLRVAMAKTEL